MKWNTYLKVLRGERELQYFNNPNNGRFLFSQIADDTLKSPFVSKFLFEEGFRPSYPEGRKFAACISHDVDILHQPNFSGLQRIKAPLREVLEGYPGRALKYFLPTSNINPYWNIDKLLDFESKYGVSSSFYFLTLQEQEQDFNFSIDSLEPVFKQIKAAGAEIGLHGGHQAFADSAKLAQEKADLEQAASLLVTGYRSHFLKLDITRTWPILSDLNFAYDTTYGFADYPAYRNGMCYPFAVWDFKNDRELNLLEIPLVAMDVSFINYMKLTPAQTLEYLKRLVDEIALLQGVFTLLWHNNLYIGEWGKVYRSIVMYCKAKEAWFATGEQMNDWWRAENSKSYSEIVKSFS